MRFYRFVNRPSTVPIFRLVTGQTIIPIPAECEINKGTQITVPFGNMGSSRLGTSAANTPYNLLRPLNYSCTTSLTQDMQVRLSAESAGYGDAIKTSNPDVGVVMSYQNCPAVVSPPGWPDSQGSDDVTFSAIKRAGVTPATGTFTGTATLVIGSL